VSVIRMRSTMASPYAKAPGIDSICARRYEAKSRRSGDRTQHQALQARRISIVPSRIGTGSRPACGGMSQ